MTAVLLSKKKPQQNFGMHWDTYETICIRLGVVIDTTELYIFILVCHLDLDPRSQRWKKAKYFAPIISKSFKMPSGEIGYAVETCWFD